ncbi:NAD(P)/FAD-dependent oxidoreductase [Aquitalea palustris]|uniref:NAD(P)/FAD-dependent oxidoreductase n=1 Tax=Aquitalea palustris TaxID=2480983 RepID=A0A454JES3_9NEIS|nr:NAD(P)/FAD-dependent oxidoreductase [Aquitalea palustris]RMC93790.1 NAD(P)/FAD-dependent oxidoreductase [Aquitalea palustris]
MDTLDCVVIGAGVVGLAIARQLAMAGREVLICEAESQIGQHCSSRNSEVIHAGLYYPSGSLKARLCVQGRDLLYRYCAERRIPHQRIGKLLLANTVADLPRLQAIASRAATNGVHDLQWLDAAGVRALEPALSAHAALLSPSTGIIDSHALLQALLADAEAHGAQLACHSPLNRGRVLADGMELEIAGITIKARSVINAAGAWAAAVASNIEGVPRETIPTAHYARGVYFSLSGHSPFSRLIYPLPEAGGLGCHLTLDLAGQARFGPDVEWIDGVDYQLDPARAAAFYHSIRQWWPQLADGALQPGYAGVRPKLAGPSEPDADFVIQGPAEYGIAGLINLYGIESPGLTSCLALAAMVGAMANQHR